MGAAASQGVAIATGMQNGFDWKGVALGAIGAGVTAGLGAAQLGSNAARALQLGGKTGQYAGIALSRPGTLYSNGIGLELERIGSIPYGFASADDFASFGQNLRIGLGKVGYADAEPILQGSAVTGKSFRKGASFDVGRVSDFDIALAGDSVFEAARGAGIPLRSGATRMGPLTERNLRQLGLYDLSLQMSTQAGRPVNFMIFNSTESAVQRAPSALFPQ